MSQQPYLLQFVGTDAPSLPITRPSELDALMQHGPGPGEGGRLGMVINRAGDPVAEVWDSINCPAVVHVMRDKDSGEAVRLDESLPGVKLLEKFGSGDRFFDLNPTSENYPIVYVAHDELAYLSEDTQKKVGGYMGLYWLDPAIATHLAEIRPSFYLQPYDHAHCLPVDDELDGELRQAFEPFYMHCHSIEDLDPKWVGIMDVDRAGAETEKEFEDEVHEAFSSNPPSEPAVVGERMGAEAPSNEDELSP